MTILRRCGIHYIYHYAPLHYLPFIARARAILCKESIRLLGFPYQHLRSKSKNQDVQRGFGAYAFLTTSSMPPILRAKLIAGFPHIRVQIPAAEVDLMEFSLCRYNVAMTRQLRRGSTPGFQESDTNGRYYDNHQIPVARTEADKFAMMQMHLPRETMIEVLIHGDCELSDETKIVCFSEEDSRIANNVLSELGCDWNVQLSTDTAISYSRSAEYVQAIEQFIARSLLDPDWRGNGLEFDNV